MGNGPDGEPRPAASAAPVTLTVKEDIELWLSPDPQKRNGSLDRLLSRGDSAAPLLVDSMFRNSKDQLRQSQLQAALREIGPRSSAPIEQALDRIGTVKRSEDVMVLEDLTETLIAIGGRRSVPTALAQLAKIASVPIRDRVMAEHINNARLRIVLKLAVLGCPDAVDEAIAYLGEGTLLVPLAIFDALEKSGDSRAALPLLRLYPRQTAASEVSGRMLQEAFRAIAKREKLTPDSACLAEAGAAEKELAEKWLPKR